MNLQCFTYNAEFPFCLYYCSVFCFPSKSLCMKGQVTFCWFVYFGNMHNYKDSWAGDVPRTTCNYKNSWFRLSVMLIPWELPGFFFFVSSFLLLSFSPSFSFLLHSSWLFFLLSTDTDRLFPLSYCSSNSAA